MAGDRDDQNSTGQGFIQTDLYGYSYEAQLPDSPSPRDPGSASRQACRDENY